MSDRARALSERFERANDAVIAIVESLSDADWRGRCEAEGWTVAATARHVGRAHARIAALVEAVATARAPAMTRDQVDEINDREGPEHAACSREEALALLRREGEAASRVIRGLSDEQLDRIGSAFLGSARARPCAPRTSSSAS